MFDCIEFESVETKLQRRKKRVDAIRHINIFHHCACCGKKIKTFWDEQHNLDGRWMALDTDDSEIFESLVSDPQRILCNCCYGSGEWKKKGIRWK